MKLSGTYLLSLLLIALLGVFVWGWYAADKDIPEIIFAGLLGLIGTLVGYVWTKDQSRES